MQLVVSKQMREIDRMTIDGGHVSGTLLMDRAGRGVFEIIRRRFGDKIAGRRIVVVCGKGNNGGDGFVIARCLLEQRAEVSVFVLTDDLNLSPDAKDALHKLIPLHPSLSKFSDPGAKSEFARRLRESELVVDALFGTGISAPLREDALEVVRAMNQLARRILSVDVPSGFSGDPCSELGETVHATFTATIGLPKQGLFYYPGREVAGEVETVNIGLPDDIVAGLGIRREIVDFALAASLLPGFDPAGHKYRRGSLLLVSGSRRYGGAALLTTGAALRGGAGMVYSAVPESLRPLVQAAWPSAITIGLPEDEHGDIAPAALDLLREAAGKVEAVAMGPGLGRAEATQDWQRRWLADLPLPAVLDADALFVWRGGLDELAAQPGARILTPHSGELGAILDLPAAELDAAREEALHSVCREGVLLLHKGAPSEVIGADGIIHTIAGGHPGMARGGTGDVLTGLLGSLLAQDPAHPQAMTLAAAWIHAEAGRRAALIQGRGLCSSDLIDALPAVWLVMEGAAAPPEPWR